MIERLALNSSPWVHVAESSRGWQLAGPGSGLEPHPSGPLHMDIRTVSPTGVHQPLPEGPELGLTLTASLGWDLTPLEWRWLWAPWGPSRVATMCAFGAWIPLPPNSSWGPQRVGCTEQRGSRAGDPALDILWWLNRLGRAHTSQCQEVSRASADPDPLPSHLLFAGSMAVSLWLLAMLQVRPHSLLRLQGLLVPVMRRGSLEEESLDWTSSER